MHVVHYLPWKYGVSTELSPETIMTGFPSPDYNKLKIELCSFDQVFDATCRPDILIDQNNHDLAVKVSENDSDSNSVHENLYDTGFDDDDQKSEVEQNI